MPRPSKPDRYPVEFHKALDAALSHREFSIPTTNPAKLRMHFYGFIGALRRDGSTKGDLIEVLSFPDRITLRHRSQNPLALEISSALSQLGDIPSPAEESSLFDRLTKE